MRIRFTLLVIAVVFGISAKAQVWTSDSVSMGAQAGPPPAPSYHEDVFYSLKNGTQKNVTNMNWHVAFQMTPQGPYGNVSVFANHAQTKVEVYSMNTSATAKYASLAAGDTVGKMGKQLYNTDTSWNWGAFNVSTTGNPLDYGWGVYSISTHHVTGDSLYVLKIGSQTYKLWIQEYKSTPADSVQWRFRIAKFDGSSDTTIRIYRKPNYENRLFVYYNADSRTVIDREPNRDSWDLMFTRYIGMIAQGPGPLVPYPLMGVQSNFGVRVAEVTMVDPDTTTSYMAYPYSHLSNTIGSDWKSYDQPNMKWKWSDSTTFFIETDNTNEVYQLAFTRFDGASTGKSVFKKRKMGNLASVNEVNSAIKKYALAPNPATDRVNVILSAEERTEARILIVDMSGRTVINKAVAINKGLNALAVDVSSYPTGTYIVNVSNGSWKVSDRVVVQH